MGSEYKSAHGRTSSQNSERYGKRGNGAPKSSEVCTFRFCANGRILELVRNSANDSVSLLVNRDRKYRIVDRYEDNGRVLIPPRIEKGLLKSIQLPSHPRKFGSSYDLLLELASHAEHHVTLPFQSLMLVSAFVLSTWLADRFPRAPYLSVFGPLGSGKTQLLQFLSCCCRRPLLLTDVTPAGLYSLVDALQLTLIIDECEFGRDQKTSDLLRLLRGGHTAGSSIFRGHRDYNLYGPKVIASRGPIRDAALASRAIQISMSRSHASVPPLDPERLRKLAAILQPKLLAFRLVNYRIPLPLDADLRFLTPRSRDLARALAAPLHGHLEQQKMIVRYLMMQDNDLRTQQMQEPELLVLDALFQGCHAPAQYITVGGVAKIVNYYLSLYGERGKFDARFVGPKLRGLGFNTEKLGSMGYGLWLTKSVINQIHRLAQEYRLTLNEEIRYYYGCPICYPKPQSSEQKA